MKRSTAVGLGLMCAGFAITLGVFALLRFLGLPWGPALACAALAGAYGVVSGALQ